MSRQTTNDEDSDQQILTSLPPTNQRASQAQLITKIYYPDTLYPDNYSFFADRADPTTLSSQNKTTISMEPTDQYPTIESTGAPSTTITTTLPRQAATEIEIIDRSSKYPAPMLDRERGESESDKRRFDFKRHLPSALRPQDKNQPPGFALDPRFYSMKKTAMTILCLLIIIMSNSVQLKHVLKDGSKHTFYGTQVTLGIVSVLICASIGFYLMYMLSINDQDAYEQRKVDFLQNLGLIFLFGLFILNIIYTIFHAI